MSKHVPRLKFIISAPGKVILHGEHSVVFGKTALAASLDLRTMLTFQTVKDNLDESNIELNLPCINLHQLFNIKEVTNALLSGPIVLTKGVDESSFNFEKPGLIDFSKLVERVKTFVRKLGDKIPLTSTQESAILSFFCVLTGMFSCVTLPLQKFSITITTDLTIESGMGSSASYGVCLSAALIHYIRSRLSLIQEGGKDISKKGLKTLNVWCTDLGNFNSREKDMIYNWALLSDRIMHGNPSGIDNAICTYGSIIQFKKGKENADIKVIPDPKILKILLVHTGITRDTAKMVAAAASMRERHTSVVDSILSAMDKLTISAAEVLKQLSNLPNETSSLEVSAQSELTKLGELIDMNQSLLQALGVSHATLDNICRIVQDHGLHGKLTGAGGGGYAYVMLPPHVQQSRIDSLKSELEKKSFSCRAVRLGGPGVMLQNT